MAPKGLPTVEQKFTADASGYIRAIKEMISANEDLVDSINEIQGDIVALKGKEIKITVDAKQALADIAAVKKALGELGDKTIHINAVSNALGDVRDNAGAAGKVLTETVKGLKDVADGIKDIDALGRAQGLGQAARELEKMAAAMKRMEADNLSAAADNLEKMAGGASRAEAAMEQVARAQERIIRQANEIGTRQGSFFGVPLGPRGEQPIPGMGDVPSPWVQGTFFGRHFTNMRDAGTRAGTTWGDALPGMGAVPASWVQGEFRGPGFRAPRPEAAGIPPIIPPSDWLPPGGTGGGGDGGGGGSHFMTAAAYAASIARWVKGVSTAVHYVSMAILEASSVVVPAIVAASAATAVGLQGYEQIAGRGAATFTVAEGLGHGYGVSAGQMMGLGGALQAAQNRYQGGVYGLTGGLMQLGQMGAGSFLTMGGNTLAMMDRGMAAMVNNAQARGTANQLNQILGGGTNYLRDFGDIGANLGNLLLGMAPNLPGVGGLMLGGLKGGTGLLSSIVGGMDRNGMGALLGALMAGEAGWRIGTPGLGLIGRGAGGIGRGLGALGGFFEKPGFGGGTKIGGFLSQMLGRTGLTAADISAMPAEDLAGLMAASGVSSEAGLLGMFGSGAAGGMMGLAGLLGGITGPVAAALGIGAWEGSMLGRYKTPTEQAIAQQQAAIGKAPFSAALQPLSAALSWATPTSAASNLPVLPAAISDPRGFVTRQRQADRAAVSNLGETVTGQIMGWAQSAQQLKPVLDKMGIHGASFADAMQIATASLLDVNHAIDPKTHRLTADAVTQVADFVKAVTGANIKGGALQGGSGIQGASALMSALSSQTIMGSPLMKSMQQVNQAADSMTQLMTGGSDAAASLFGLLGGTPVAHRRGGLEVAAGAKPGTRAFAGALRSPFTAGGAAAWSTFGGQLLPAAQQFMDQTRMELALGALGPLGAQQLDAFTLAQLLPETRGSPAALANLMSMGMQANIPGMGYYDPRKSQAQNFAAALKAFGGSMPSAARANQLNNQQAIAMSNLPGVAGGLMMSLAPGMTAALAGDTITQGLALAQGKGDVNALMADLRGQRVKPGDMAGTAAALLTQLGAAHSIVVKIKEEIQKAEVPKPKDQTAHIVWINKVPGAPKVRDLTANINYIVHVIGGGGTGFVPSPSGGVPFARAITQQLGGLVPGHGSGDIIPAMLEPGELVVPRNMVQAGMVSHLQGKIPGFQGGAFLPMTGSPFGIFESAAAGAINNLAITVSALAQAIVSGGFSPAVSKIFGAGAKSFGGNDIFSEFGRTIMEGLIDGIKNAKGETARAAHALVSSVTQEVTYGKNIAAAAKQGLGFNPWGGGQTLLSTFGNLATPTMTAGGQPYQYYIDQASGQPLSVQQQMGDYLQAMKSFTGDLSKLGKQGLNKNLMQQLIAAGPLAGDQMAQSILGGAGGAKGANQLWSQINAEANKLGITGAGLVSGKNVNIGVNASAGPVHALQAAIDHLHGKTITIRVNVVEGTGGSGGHGAGGGALPKHVLSQVQTSLLIQAHNNRRTGVQLPGYGA